MTMEAKVFDSEGVGVGNGNYFGMPFTENEAALVLVSVPWDVTASYGGGSATAPDEIIEASTQLDFYDEAAPLAWQRGIATLGIDYRLAERNERLRGEARKVIEHFEGKSLFLEERLFALRLRHVNEASAVLNRYVESAVSRLLRMNKLVGLVGGDHSVSLGAIRATADSYGEIGVLQFDAHADLRRAYEEFTYSHASIMWNVLNEVPGVSKIVQVGVRDQSETEHRTAIESDRIEQFSMWSLRQRLFVGEQWTALCEEIIEHLPQQVYISFDIDALDVQYCPSTGTPVPGGLTFDEARYLINAVRSSGRSIVGFDLCEVSHSAHTKIDANVGARVLFALCGATLKQEQ